MNDINQWLREGDPGAHESGPSAAEMADLLDHIARNASACSRTSYFFPVRRWQIVTVVVAFIAVVLWAGMPEWNRVVKRNQALAAVSPQPARELYFTTPEGIRVIWIFRSPASE